MVLLALGSARRAIVIACIGVAPLIAISCSDATTAVAQDVLSRMVPPGSAKPALQGPSRSGESLQFSWAVESDMKSRQLGDWLRGRLSEFEVINASELELNLAKHMAGDAYRVHITLQSESHITRAHVQLTASPD